MTSSLRLIGPLLLALASSGCAGLLGGGKPDRLYRFGISAAAASPSAAIAVPTRTLILATPAFASEVSGPRLLTVEGGRASYVKDARWVAPAPLLFGAAVKAGFGQRAPWIAMVDRRGKAGGDVLQLSIARFEADYAGAGPPTVRVQGEALLADGAGGVRLAAFRIAEEQPAAADAVGAIAAAFDVVTARAVTGIVDWAARIEVARSNEGAGRNQASPGEPAAR